VRDQVVLKERTQNLVPTIGHAKHGIVNMSLYKNIHAKRKRIKKGSGEKMRKPGSKGAPTAKAFKKAAKTARKRK